MKYTSGMLCHFAKIFITRSYCYTKDVVTLQCFKSVDSTLESRFTFVPVTQGFDIYNRLPDMIFHIKIASISSVFLHGSHMIFLIVRIVPQYVQTIARNHLRDDWGNRNRLDRTEV